MIICQARYVPVFPLYISSLIRHLQAQQYLTNDLIHDGGMSIDFEPLKINGRILNTPGLQYGGGPPFVCPPPFLPRLSIDPRSQNPENGAWNVMKKQFHTAEALSVWSVVNFEPSIPNQVVEGFARSLQACCNRLGEF